MDLLTSDLNFNKLVVTVGEIQRIRVHGQSCSPIHLNAESLSSRYNRLNLTLNNISAWDELVVDANLNSTTVVP